MGHLAILKEESNPDSVGNTPSPTDVAGRIAQAATPLPPQSAVDSQSVEDKSTFIDGTLAVMDEPAPEIPDMLVHERYAKAEDQMTTEDASNELSVLFHNQVWMHTGLSMVGAFADSVRFFQTQVTRSFERVVDKVNYVHAVTGQAPSNSLAPNLWAALSDLQEAFDAIPKEGLGSSGDNTESVIVPLLVKVKALKEAVRVLEAYSQSGNLQTMQGSIDALERGIQDARTVSRSEIAQLRTHNNNDLSKVQKQIAQDLGTMFAGDVGDILRESKEFLSQGAPLFNSRLTQLEQEVLRLQTSTASYPKPQAHSSVTFSASAPQDLSRTADLERMVDELRVDFAGLKSDL